MKIRQTGFTYRRGCKCWKCAVSRADKPRIRGPICGAVWACKGDGHITSGMTPEEAYSKWLAWQEGAQ